VPDVLLTEYEPDSEAVLDDTGDVRVHALLSTRGDVVDVDAESP
jgi:hypothetical protein